MHCFFVRNRTRGFTLIELMMTVAIIGVLAAIAFPSYTKQAEKGRRAQAQATMFSAAQYLQRYYLARGTYSAATLPTAYQTSDGYAITLAVGTDSQSYTITATPSVTEPVCANLSLRDTGAKGASGTGTIADCWS